MRILNGKKYYTRADVSKTLTLCKEIVKNPHSYLYNDLDFIYSLDSEEKDCIIFGMESLFNTFSWEYMSEYALNFEKINELYLTLDVPASDIMDFDSYQLLTPPAITTKVLKQYENWLNYIGRKIFLNEIKKS
tara:strand:+ start:3315 stop:3713 length:399 start_codon:yes stop_codon:yes gene_type:complete